MNKQQKNLYARQLRLMSRFVFTAKQRGYKVNLVAEIDGVAMGVSLDTSNPLVNNFFEDLSQFLNGFGLRMNLEADEIAPVDDQDGAILADRARPVTCAQAKNGG